MIRSRKVLATAKGAECAARFPGICRGGTETTVWAHMNGAAFGKGMAMKAHDILGFHACFWCHAYTDTGHWTNPVMSDAEFWRSLLDAMAVTYVRIVEAGVVIVPFDPPKEHKPKPRKPKTERAPIIQRKTKWPKRSFS